MINFKELNATPPSSGSHLPVFDIVFACAHIKRVVEFGMGDWSTPYLIGKGVELFSVDNEQRWIDKFVDPKNTKHKGYCYTWETMKDVLDKELAGQFFDLIFVDGHYRSRLSCAEKSWHRAEIIMWHDTQGAPYSWDKVKIAPEYKEIVFKFCNAWTTVWTNNKAVFESISYWNEVIRKYKEAYNRLCELKDLQ
ncbi:MAG: hypothetical protein V1709_08620 [Planctomycetota bacterium]